jgi:hypothetical protein
MPQPRCNQLDPELRHSLMKYGFCVAVFVAIKVLTPIYEQWHIKEGFFPCRETVLRLRHAGCHEGPSPHCVAPPTQETTQGVSFVFFAQKCQPTRQKQQPPPCQICARGYDCPFCDAGSASTAQM